MTNSFDMTELESWLTNVNQDFSREEVAHISRPLLAMSRLSIEKKVSITFPSPIAFAIFDSFEKHSPAEAHNIGDLFSGTFYYDAHFWKIQIPIGYGEFTLNVIDSVQGMPSTMKMGLAKTASVAQMLSTIWLDTFDYGYGFNDFSRGLYPKVSTPFAAGLIVSADRELRATVSLLTESRDPNQKAFESARMSVEIFLKAYLAVNAGLTDKVARDKYGHDLEKLVSACELESTTAQWSALRPMVRAFATIGARYQANSYSKQELWSGHLAALLAAVTVMRSIGTEKSRVRIKGGE